LRADGTWAAPSGLGGTVTSVGVSSSGAYSAALTIGSSPVTSSGTITITPNLFNTSTAGIVPASGGGTSNFLRADGTWAVPPGGGGTVTSVSVTSANGFGGTVATATTTPAITISTSVTGVLKGNGTAISAATAGTDYSSGTSALATGILKSTTGTGALSIAVAADFPTLNQNTTGTAANATNIAITNDVATATAVYPVWSGANAGNNAAQTSSTELSFVPSTGMLTATGFAGPLNGAVGGTTPAAGAFTTIDASSTVTLNGNVVVGAGNLDIQGSTTPQLNLVDSGGQTWTIGYNAGSAIVGYYDATGGNWGFYIGNGATGACTFPRGIASTSVTTGTVVVTGGIGISATTASTSTTTGAIVNTGGMGNAGQVTMTAISTGSPTTKTANYSLTATDTSLIFNGSGSLTLTLQAASSYPGRWVYVKTIAAQTVVSASSNVVSLAGGAAGTAILAATAGKWAALQSDGTNWVIMMSN
jgi:hypothetical protein